MGTVLDVVLRNSTGSSHTAKSAAERLPRGTGLVSAVPHTGGRLGGRGVQTLASLILKQPFGEGNGLQFSRQQRWQPEREELAFLVSATRGQVEEEGNVAWTEEGSPR